MKELYWKIVGILDQMSMLIRETRQQNYQIVVNRINGMMERLNAVIEALFNDADYFGAAGLNIQQDYVLQILAGLLEAQQNEDYVMYGDLLQLQMIPLLIDVQNAIRNMEDVTFLLQQREDTYERNMNRLQKRDEQLYNTLQQWQNIWKDGEHAVTCYSVEPTTIGFPTLAIENNGKRYYLHSNYNPYEEARCLADTYYDVDKTKYVIYGLGLGYHVAVLAVKDRSAKIYVYESDIAVIHNCMMYNQMDWYFADANISIVYDPAFTLFQSQIEQGDAVLMLHRPSIHNIMNTGIRDKMGEVARKENSVRVYENVFVQNSRSNFALCDAYVDELQAQFERKRVIIVAGGPSLDKNVELLQQKNDDTVIFAVGAVFRKLIDLGISVDYVIVIDPKIDTWNQIKGLEEEKVPMLLMSTATREIAQYYKGKKYLICQQGYDRAEQYANERGYHLYSSGGSVATTALDIVIHFRAAAIIFVGLDLAFTGDQMHATGSGIQAEISEGETVIEVPAIGGGVVRTCRPFDICRRWMERRIQKPDVTMPIYDATEGGARKEGMQEVKLQDILQGKDDR